MSEGPFFREEAPQGFQKVVLPMIRKVIPNAIMEDILSVQPMMEPSGLIFSLRPKYTKPEPIVEPNLVDLINEVFE